jgi:hypothetical protein
MDFPYKDFRLKFYNNSRNFGRSVVGGLQKTLMEKKGMIKFRKGGRRK